MKENIEKNIHKDNFVRQIGNRLLFVRSANKNEISKLANGKTTDFIFRKEKYPVGSIGNFAEHGEVRKKYGLEKSFEFNHPFYEFVGLNEIYKSFEAFLENTLKESPQISFKDFLKLEFNPVEIKVKRKVGRTKLFKDENTGKIVGISKKNQMIIELWEEGKNFEEIRFTLYLKTRTMIEKRRQISKIKRVLRQYNYLLERKYFKKDRKKSERIIKQ